MSDEFDDFDLSEFDVTDDAADIIDDYDDDSDDDSDDSGGASSIADLSEAEIQKRLSDYQKQTQMNMQKALKAKQYKKAERLEALRWLGESGNPKAISALFKVYKKDKTPGMKEAAAYALGQFRAQKRDQDDPEMAAIADQRINDIILFGKFGKRANATGMIIIEIILVVLAIALFSMGGVFSARNTVERQTQEWIMTATAPTWTPDSETAVRNAINLYYGDLNADANFYQQQLGAAGRGESQNCDLSLLANHSQDYNLTEMWAADENFASLVTELNSIRTRMDDVRIPYNNACRQGPLLTRQEAINLGGVIIEVQRSLATALETLNSSGVEVTEQVFATSTPAPTDTPDPNIPTATEDLTEVNTIILSIQRLIDDMTIRNPAPVPSILFNWQQVVDTGEIYRSGCNQPEPIIPEDYALPEDSSGDLTARFPELASAINNLNIGLQSLRASATAFYASCTAGEVPENAIANHALAELADTAFDSATSDLDAIRNR